MEQAAQEQYWSCTLNGEFVNPTVIQQFPVSATVNICSGLGRLEGNNQFLFTLNGFNNQSTGITFDYLEIFPIASLTPQTYHLLDISYDDTSINYQGDWVPLSDAGDNAVGTRAGIDFPSLEYSFNGLWQRATTYWATIMICLQVHPSHLLRPK